MFWLGVQPLNLSVKWLTKKELGLNVSLSIMNARYLVDVSNQLGSEFQLWIYLKRQWTILRRKLKTQREHWEAVGRPSIIHSQSNYTTRSLGFLFYALRKSDYIVSKDPYIATVQEFFNWQCSPSPRPYPIAIKWSLTLVTSHYAYTWKTDLIGVVPLELKMLVINSPEVIIAATLVCSFNLWQLYAISHSFLIPLLFMF